MASNLQLFNKTLADTRTQNYLQMVLGEKRASFVNNLTALVANNAALQKCEPLSLMYAAIKATALDLPLDANLGFAYVIPYNNSSTDKSVATFQMGYKGYIQLAIRSGQFAGINVTEVKEGELLDESLVTGEIRFARAPQRETLKTIGYVAYFRLLNGLTKQLYMTAGEVEAHAKRYSQTYGSSYESTRKSSKWSTDFDAMAKKTVLKRLLSQYAPLSVEMQQAQVIDQAVIRQDGTCEYVDRPDGAEDAGAADVAPVTEDGAAEAREEMRRESERIAEEARGRSNANAERVGAAMQQAI